VRVRLRLRRRSRLRLRRYDSRLRLRRRSRSPPPPRSPPPRSPSPPPRYDSGRLRPCCANTTESCAPEALSESLPTDSFVALHGWGAECRQAATLPTSCTRSAARATHCDSQSAYDCLLKLTSPRKLRTWAFETLLQAHLAALDILAVQARQRILRVPRLSKLDEGYAARLPASPAHLSMQELQCMTRRTVRLRPPDQLALPLARDSSAAGAHWV